MLEIPKVLEQTICQWMVFHSLVCFGQKLDPFVCFSHLPLLADKPGVKVLCGLGHMATVTLQFLVSWWHTQLKLKQGQHSGAVILNIFSTHLKMYYSISISRFKWEFIFLVDCLLSCSFAHQDRPLYSIVLYHYCGKEALSSLALRTPMRR